MRTSYVVVLLCLFCAILALLGGCSRGTYNESALMLRARMRMVDRLEHSGRITDPRVLEAMREIPRQAFLPADAGIDPYAENAATDNGYCSPLMVGLAMQESQIFPKHRVLMIDPPDAYPAAVAARLCQRVCVLCSSRMQVATMIQQLGEVGVTNVEVHCGNATQGWSETGPYHAIIVRCDSREVPEGLCDQMDRRGLMLQFQGPNARTLQVLRVRNGEFIGTTIVQVGTAM
jgi:protein-L-isoaspartate(D-aspartate) O-methyltransferase